mgnify:CR=1 FL=1
MTDKAKKQLGIAIGVILLIAALIVGFLFFTQSGKDTRNEAAVAFQPVEVPQDSRELSKVPTAPVNKPDKDDDPFLNRDMLGQRISDDPIEIEIPLEEDTSDTAPSNNSKENKDSNSPSRNNSNSSKPSNKPRTTTTTIKPPSAEEMRQVSNTGVEFSIPSVGLYTPLGSLQEVRGIIRPTNFNNVFQITNRGVAYDKTREGTTYLAAHTLDADQTAGGLAPGNFIIDANTKQPKIKNGDKINVGNETFSVTELKREGKGLISNDANIWDASVKDRLVLILCWPNSNDNYVIIAQHD